MFEEDINFSGIQFQSEICYSFPERVKERNTLYCNRFIIQQLRPHFVFIHFSVAAFVH